jgi:hypothetical protein
VAVIRQTGRATSETGRESLMRSATVPRALDRGERFRRGRHRVALVVAATAVPVLLLAPPLHVAAQAGTPVAVAPGRCEVEPRSAADLAALAGATPRPAETAPATPETPPLAPPDVVSGVAATMAELAACTNAGEAARALALFSDDLFLAFFGGLSSEDLGTMLTRSPPSRWKTRSPRSPSKMSASCPTAGSRRSPVSTGCRAGSCWCGWATGTSTESTPSTTRRSRRRRYRSRGSPLNAAPMGAGTARGDGHPGGRRHRRPPVARGRRYASRYRVAYSGVGGIGLDDVEQDAVRPKQDRVALPEGLVAQRLDLLKPGGEQPGDGRGGVLDLEVEEEA